MMHVRLLLEVLYPLKQSIALALIQAKRLLPDLWLRALLWQLRCSDVAGVGIGPNRAASYLESLE